MAGASRPAQERRRSRSRSLAEKGRRPGHAPPLCRRCRRPAASPGIQASDPDPEPRVEEHAERPSRRVLPLPWAIGAHQERRRVAAARHVQPTPGRRPRVPAGRRPRCRTGRHRAAAASLRSGRGVRLEGRLPALRRPVWCSGSGPSPPPRRRPSADVPDHGQTTFPSVLIRS